MEKTYRFFLTIRVSSLSYIFLIGVFGLIFNASAQVNNTDTQVVKLTCNYTYFRDGKVHTKLFIFNPVSQQLNGESIGQTDKSEGNRKDVRTLSINEVMITRTRITNADKVTYNINRITQEYTEEVDDRVYASGRCETLKQAF